MAGTLPDGDEGFGGYALYRRIASITRWQTLPMPIWRGASVALALLDRLAVVPERLPQRLTELAGADDTAITQNLLCWVRGEEHKRLCQNMDALPVRRLFEPQWEHALRPSASRLERLSAKAKGWTCKRVLHAVAKSWLPPTVASKPKQGFAIPVDDWVNADFKVRLRDVLLAPSSRLPEFFRPEAYRPMLEAFCEGYPCPGIARQGLYQRAMMLLSVHLVLCDGR